MKNRIAIALYLVVIEIAAVGLALYTRPARAQANSFVVVETAASLATCAQSGLTPAPTVICAITTTPPQIAVSSGGGLFQLAVGAAGATGATGPAGPQGIQGPAGTSTAGVLSINGHTGALTMAWPSTAPTITP